MQPQQPQPGTAKTISKAGRQIAKLEQDSISAHKAGDYAKAFELCCECMLKEPGDDMHKLRAGLAARDISFRGFSPKIKRALTLCLQCDSIEHQKFVGAWASLLRLDPLHKKLMALSGCGSYADFAQALDWRALQPSLTDPFLTQGLRMLLLADAELERLFTHLRRYILTLSDQTGMLKTRHLPFLCALAENAFLNEYVFTESAAETQSVTALRHQIEQTEESREHAAAQDGALPIKWAVLAAYRPLSALTAGMKEQDPASQAEHQNKDFQSLLSLQAGEPAEEERLKQNIPALGSICDVTSQKVQDMYEDNPYPRWRTVDLPPRAYSGTACRWLAAGCGTGRPLTQAALMFPNVRFTAIDLSRASLAYAKRQAARHGIGNIAFYQADILELDKAALEPELFDIIECSGVLHHMKDPTAGWAQLIGRLAPGGRMNIGLYSTRAREVVAAARQYVRDKAYPPTQEGIRAFRQDVLDLPEGDPLKPVSRRRDFYALSECRDLVFHVQEKTYTIAEIREVLAALGLAFLGFRPPGAGIAPLYAKRFPGDPGMTNLANWEELEGEMPDLFIGMYQFLCCRKDEVGSPSQEWQALEKTGFLSQ